jgi:hypothetical protein
VKKTIALITIVTLLGLTSCTRGGPRRLSEAVVARIMLETSELDLERRRNIETELDRKCSDPASYKLTPVERAYNNMNNMVNDYLPIVSGASFVAHAFLPTYPDVSPAPPPQSKFSKITSWVDVFGGFCDHWVFFITRFCGSLILQAVGIEADKLKTLSTTVTTIAEVSSTALFLLQTPNPLQRSIASKEECMTYRRQRGLDID